MKKLNLLFLVLIGFFFVACDSNDDTDGDWAKSTEFAGGNRVGAVSFTDPKDGDVYIGMGLNSTLSSVADRYMRDFYVFRQGAWQRVVNADYPKEGRQGSVAFVIDRIAYVGSGFRGTFAGHTEEEYFCDFYMFDLDKETWIKDEKNPKEFKKITIADYEPNTEECSFYGGIAFSHGNKGYVGTGKLKDRIFKTIYCYDPQTGKWSNSGFDGYSRVGGVTFAIGDNHVVCLGAGAGGDCVDVWVFNGQWTRKRNLADVDGKWNDDYDDIPRSYAVAFTANDRGTDKGFIAGGNKKSCWEYHLERDLWDKVTGFPAAMATRFGAIGFSYNGYGYITTGGSSVDRSDDNSTWVFYPGIDEDDNNDY